MESNISLLTPLRELMLDTIEQNNGLLGVKDLANLLVISEATAQSNVIFMEQRLGLIISKKQGYKKILYLRKESDVKIKEPSDEDKLRKELMAKLSLDDLELEILEKVEVGESISEAAIKVKALIRQVEIRMEVSIPFKLKVKSFGEAKAPFEERKKELKKHQKDLKIAIAA